MRSPGAWPAARCPESIATHGTTSQKKAKSSPIISWSISRHAAAPNAPSTVRRARPTSAGELTTGGYARVVHVSPNAVVCTSASRKSTSASTPCAAATPAAAVSIAARSLACAPWTGTRPCAWCV